MKRCKPPNCSITIEKPKASATTNAMNEVDLYDDDNWEVYCTISAYRRPMTGRELEINSQVIADRTDVFEMWGTNLTRQIKATYRLKYTDRDAVVHTMGIFDIQVLEDEVSWVVLKATEDVS